MLYIYLRTLWKSRKGFDKPVSVAGSALLVVLTIALIITALSGMSDTAVSQLLSASESAPEP